MRITKKILQAQLDTLNKMIVSERDVFISRSRDSFFTDKLAEAQKITDPDT